MSALTASLCVALADLQVADLHTYPTIEAELLVEVVKLVFWLHCTFLSIVHVEDGLLERGNVLSGTVYFESL